MLSYFILKALFVLRYLNFCLTLWSIRDKGNQTMKFGQLIEYNKRNIFSSKIMPKMRKRD